MADGSCIDMTDKCLAECITVVGRRLSGSRSSFRDRPQAGLVPVELRRIAAESPGTSGRLVTVTNLAKLTAHPASSFDPLSVARSRSLRKHVAEKTEWRPEFVVSEGPRSRQASTVETSDPARCGTPDAGVFRPSSGPRIIGDPSLSLPTSREFSPPPWRFSHHPHAGKWDFLSRDVGGSPYDSGRITQWSPPWENAHQPSLRGVLHESVHGESAGVLDTVPPVRTRILRTLAVR